MKRSGGPGKEDHKAFRLTRQAVTTKAWGEKYSSGQRLPSGCFGLMLGSIG